jgi:hypothetical protein
MSIKGQIARLLTNTDLEILDFQEGYGVLIATVQCPAGIGMLVARQNEEELIVKINIWGPNGHTEERTMKHTIKGEEK